MAKFIVSMPEGWTPDIEDSCPNPNGVCLRCRSILKSDCCLAGAKPVENIKHWDLDNCAGNSKLRDKPVRLYAEFMEEK